MRPLMLRTLAVIGVCTLLFIALAFVMPGNAQSVGNLSSVTSAPMMAAINSGGDSHQKPSAARAVAPLVEVIGYENIPGSFDSNVIPRGYARLHDKASGIELLCFRDSDSDFKASISCVPTGRSWK